MYLETWRSGCTSDCAWGWFQSCKLVLCAFYLGSLHSLKWQMHRHGRTTEFDSKETAAVFAYAYNRDLVAADFVTQISGPPKECHNEWNLDYINPPMNSVVNAWILQPPRLPFTSKDLMWLLQFLILLTSIHILRASTPFLWEFHRILLSFYSSTISWNEIHR